MSVFGLLAVVAFTMSSTEVANAEGTMCETTGYYSASEQAFICDGGGSTTCWYRCPKKKEVGIQ